QLVISVEFDKLPYSAHGVKVEVQVVDCIQYRRQDLIRHEEMPQIGAGICLANRTTACGVNWSGIFLVLGILDHDAAIPGEQRTVPCMPCRHDTVEHIHAECNAFDEIGWCPDAHQVSRPVFRE